MSTHEYQEEYIKKNSKTCPIQLFWLEGGL